MQLYSGIDLHNNNSIISLIDDNDRLSSEKRLNNNLDAIHQHLMSYQDDMSGIVVKSTYNWSWLVDGLIEKGYPVHLARLVSGLVLLAACWLGSTTVSAESLDNLAGIVRVEHTRSFTDVDRLAFSLETAPLVEVELTNGRSPSELIKDTYGFGASDAPDAYALVESRILEANGAADATKLRAGKVFVPDLPVMTSQRPSLMYSTGPDVRNASAEVKIERPTRPELTTFAYSKPIRIGVPIAQSLTYTRIDRYSATEAARIMEEAKRQNSVVAGGLEAGIKLAANPSVCNEAAAEVLSADERSTITAALKGSTDQTERYIIVLDTGWPTFDDQARSLTHLRRIFDAVRSSLRVQQSQLSRFDPVVPATAFVPTSHAHACMIARSLREFIALDENKRIQTIYLPLRPGQAEARDVFREILELDLLISTLGNQPFSRTPLPIEIDRAKSFASEALTQLPALKEPWVAGDDVVRIYEPLIRGLIGILDVYARISPAIAPGMAKVDARFWLSISWNFTKYAATPSLPSASNYMVFAAAGNDQVDFVVERRLFASDAAMGYRVFAVMNNDESSGALTCNSARFTTLWNEENFTSNIGSFPGRLGTAPSQPCPGPGGGTSFSTPRLAWLAAASDVSSRVNVENWPKALSLRLLKSRSKVPADPNAAPIHIMKLFASH